MPNQQHPDEMYSDEIFPKGALYFDLIFPAPPPQSALTQVLGRAAQLFGAIEADDEVEAQVPRLAMMKPTDRRLILGQAAGQPLIEASPDLRPFLQLLLGLVDRTGARIGTAGSWGEPGFFGAVAKDRNDLAWLALFGWLDANDVDLTFQTGIGASKQQKMPELEAKHKQIVAAKIESQIGGMPVGPYFLLDLLGKLGGYGQEEYKDWLKKCFSAFRSVTAPPPPKKVEEPPKEAPKVAIRAAELSGKPVLIIPKERFGLSVFEGIAKGRPEALHKIDQIPSRVQEEIARKRVHFLAQLPSLSELFIDGRPLTKDAAQKLQEPVSGSEHLTFIAHMPRFGRVRVIGNEGDWWFFSDPEVEAADLRALL